jgi:hypothetical protein
MVKNAVNKPFKIIMGTHIDSKGIGKIGREIMFKVRNLVITILLPLILVVFWSNRTGHFNKR